jgi:hypothetical protein
MRSVTFGLVVLSFISSSLVCLPSMALVIRRLWRKSDWVSFHSLIHAGLPSLIRLNNLYKSCWPTIQHKDHLRRKHSSTHGSQRWALFKSIVLLLWVPCQIWRTSVLIKSWSKPPSPSSQVSSSLRTKKRISLRYSRQLTRMVMESSQKTRSLMDMTSFLERPWKRRTS